ncbi:MAG TPA: GNAT family protein [Aggregatilineales bacterium]|nr:GNAT family protein [Aggregatilineales bacterium]
MPTESFLQGKLVELSAIQRSDLPVIASWGRDTEFLGNQFYGLLYPDNLEDLTLEFEQQHGTLWHGIESLKELPFAIRPQDGGEIIGIVQFKHFDWRSLLAEVGISVGNREYWDKGYGTDAMRVMLRYGFMELGLNRIELTVFGFNPRAVRSYEKAGFQREGSLRESLYRDGQFHDQLVLGILRTEWDALPDDQR